MKQNRAIPLENAETSDGEPASASFGGKILTSWNATRSKNKQFGKFFGKIR